MRSCYRGMCARALRPGAECPCAHGTPHRHGAGCNLAGAIALPSAPALAHVFSIRGTLVAAGVAVALVPLVILALRRGELNEPVAVERYADDPRA